jgi:hypothetical protein
VLHQVCTPAVIDAEMEVLIAEMHDALVNVRRYRRVYCSLRFFYQGQWSLSNASGAATRKRTELATASSQITQNRILYERSWDAAQRLQPNGQWAQRYRKLEAKDIRGPQPGDDLADLAAQPPPRDQGAGRYEPSWIWKTISVNDEPIEYVRVHWAKTAAHADRWSEELKIVRREMRSTIMSFDTEATRWSERKCRRQDAAGTRLGFALEAYASRQQHMLRQRSDRFLAEWLPLLKAQRMEDTMSTRYVYAAVARAAADKAEKRSWNTPIEKAAREPTILNESTPSRLKHSCWDAEEEGMWMAGPVPVSAVPGIYDDGQGIYGDGEDEIEHCSNEEDASTNSDTSTIGSRSSEED